MRLWALVLVEDSALVFSYLVCDASQVGKGFAMEEMMYVAGMLLRELKVSSDPSKLTVNPIVKPPVVHVEGGLNVVFTAA